MSMNDPISDMLTNIRNAQNSNKFLVNISCSKTKISIASILKEEGYIENFSIEKYKNKFRIIIILKYFNKNPVIKYIKRISRPGLRVYKKFCRISLVINGLGISIISTSLGIMTDKNARKKRIGGEVICHVA